MIVTSDVWTGSMQPFEAPSTQLPGERSKTGLTEEFGDYLFKEKLLVMHFPRTAVWLMDWEAERERDGVDRQPCLIEVQ